MPKVLILYDSVTGNTKKMAEEVAKGSTRSGRSRSSNQACR